MNLPGLSAFDPGWMVYLDRATREVRHIIQKSMALSIIIVERAPSQPKFVIPRN